MDSAVRQKVERSRKKVGVILWCWYMWAWLKSRQLHPKSVRTKAKGASQRVWGSQHGQESSRLILPGHERGVRAPPLGADVLTLLGLRNPRRFLVPQGFRHFRFAPLLQKMILFVWREHFVSGLKVVFIVFALESLVKNKCWTVWDYFTMHWDYFWFSPFSYIINIIEGRVLEPRPNSWGFTCQVWPHTPKWQIKTQ
jgi:hypothetical protein